MINSLMLNSLRNSEFTQYMADTLKIVAANDPATLNITDVYNTLLTANRDLEALFKAERGSAMTDVIIALDARRDNAISGMRLFINALTYHFDDAIRTSAELLDRNLSLYGPGIARENYQSETAILNKILADWTTKPEFAAAVSALQLTAWKAELDTANQAFNTQYLARNTEMGAAVPDNTVKDKRLITTNAYYQLRDFINSHYTISNQAAPYKKVVNELNALIDQYTALLNGRKSKPAIKTPVAAVAEKV